MATAVRAWWGVVAAIAAMVLVAGSAEAKDCTQAYNYLTTCLSYTSNNATTPSPQCCSGISYLNTNDPDCLCQITVQFNNSNTPGVNATKAFALPNKCGIVVDTVKCPALALTQAPGAAVAPTPPSSVAPLPSTSAAAAAPHTGLFAAFTALLAATHLVWNALTAT